MDPPGGKKGSGRQAAIAARAGYRAFLGALSSLLCLSCGIETELEASLANPIVYGTDDRREYFEVDDTELRATAAQSVVALLPKSSLERTPNGIRLQARTWGELGELCPEERFATQPAAALCSGILVDWDLVLTAGHCVRQIGLADLAVVFGYYYAAPDDLAITESDVFETVKIVSEALDPQGSAPRLDFAWLRLAERAVPPRRPAAIRAQPPKLADPIISVGTGGGVPIKIDSGATVRDVRAPWFDYFVADADTTKGSSGGAAFDRDLALSGILVRGAPDLVLTPAGCQVTAQQPLGDAAAEQFTYASRAREGLCSEDESASTVCRADCGDPCLALAPPPQPKPVVVGGGGCGMVSSADPPNALFWSAFCASLAIGLRARRRSLSPAPPVSKLCADELLRESGST